MKLAIGTGNFNKKFFLKGETLNNNNTGKQKHCSSTNI